MGRLATAALFAFLGLVLFGCTFGSKYTAAAMVGEEQCQKACTAAANSCMDGCRGMKTGERGACEKGCEAAMNACKGECKKSAGETAGCPSCPFFCRGYCMGVGEIAVCPKGTCESGKCVPYTQCGGQECNRSGQICEVGTCTWCQTTETGCGWVCLPPNSYCRGCEVGEQPA